MKTIRVAKKSDRPKMKKTKSTFIPLKDKKGKVVTGKRLGGKRQVVPNLTAMRKRGIISSMD